MGSGFTFEFDHRGGQLSCRLSSAHEFFKVCKDCPCLHSFSASISSLWDILCKAFLLHSVSHPTDNLQLQRKVHNNNVDDLKSFRYV